MVRVCMDRPTLDLQSHFRLPCPPFRQYYYPAPAVGLVLFRMDERRGRVSEPLLEREREGVDVAHPRVRDEGWA